MPETTACSGRAAQIRSVRSCVPPPFLLRLTHSREGRMGWTGWCGARRYEVSAAERRGSMAAWRHGARSQSFRRVERANKKGPGREVRGQSVWQACRRMNTPGAASPQPWPPQSLRPMGNGAACGLNIPRSVTPRLAAWAARGRGNYPRPTCLPGPPKPAAAPPAAPACAGGPCRRAAHGWRPTSARPRLPPARVSTRAGWQYCGTLSDMSTHLFG